MLLQQSAIMLFACLHKQLWMYRCRTGAGVMLMTCLCWVMVLQSLGVHSSISVRPAALLRHHGRGLIQSFSLHSSHFHPEKLRKALRDVISLINGGVYRWRRRGFRQLFFFIDDEKKNLSGRCSHPEHCLFKNLLFLSFPLDLLVLITLPILTCDFAGRLFPKQPKLYTVCLMQKVEIM